MTDRVSSVVSLVDAIDAPSPVMVAIDGMSAAGKSTLAASIVERLPDAELVHGDDFYRVMDSAERFALSPEDGYDQDFDWQRLCREVLEPLRRGRVATSRRYDWATGRLGEWAETRPAPVVVVEGVYVSRPELRSFFDIIVWVETSANTRADRQAARDDAPEWIARWDAAERWYVAHHRPVDTADLVVGGEGR